jgi:hypothetical protein
VVAVAQVAVARQGLLTPWKGGGFGMFATTDGLASRSVRIVVEGEGRSEHLEPPFELRKLVAKALALPDERRLRRLAVALLEHERRAGRPAETVSIEVWRTRYSPRNLAPSSEVLARFESDRFGSGAVAPAPQGGRAATR